MCVNTFSLRSDCMCYTCVCVCQWQRLSYTCRGTVCLRHPHFSISCFPLCSNRDSDRGRDTPRKASDRLCVCGTLSKETEREKQTGVCSSFLKSVSPTLLRLLQQQRWIVFSASPFLSSSFKKIIILHCSSLGFELDKQSKDRMEQWGLRYRSALISNDWYFVSFFFYGSNFEIRRAVTKPVDRHRCHCWLLIIHSAYHHYYQQ